MKKVISVEKLKKVFDKKTIAVDGISFDVGENEIFGLIGPNGSGKTTTLRMLTTILEPTGGTINYYDRPLDKHYSNEMIKIIGYVPQKECLYGDLTTAENLDIFSQPYHMDKKKRQANIKNMLKKLDIEQRKDSLVKNLSGGLAKRVSIAAALVHEPKILFFDEVSMGLDPNSRYHIWEITKALKDHTTIVLTTHYMDEAEELCDRIAIISRGKILDLDKPKKVIQRYRAKDLNEVIGTIIKREK